MSSNPRILQTTFEKIFGELHQVRDSFFAQLIPREMGVITGVSRGIAQVSDLPGVGSEELLKFPGDIFGIAFNVDEHEIGVVLLGDYSHL